jgi:hypothetical protein
MFIKVKAARAVDRMDDLDFFVIDAIPPAVVARVNGRAEYDPYDTAEAFVEMLWVEEQFPAVRDEIGDDLMAEAYHSLYSAPTDLSDEWPSLLIMADLLGLSVLSVVEDRGNKYEHAVTAVAEAFSSRAVRAFDYCFGKRDEDYVLRSVGESVMFISTRAHGLDKEDLQSLTYEMEDYLNGRAWVELEAHIPLHVIYERLDSIDRAVVEDWVYSHRLDAPPGVVGILEAAADLLWSSWRVMSYNRFAHKDEVPDSLYRQTPECWFEAAMPVTGVDVFRNEVLAKLLPVTVSGGNPVHALYLPSADMRPIFYITQGDDIVILGDLPCYVVSGRVMTEELTTRLLGYEATTQCFLYDKRVGNNIPHIRHDAVGAIGDSYED